MEFAKRQDLPPPGGYDPLNFARRPAKSIFPPRVLVGIYLGTSFATFYLAKLGIDKFERDQTEQRSSMMALTPMLLAERDRAYLKQLRRNRDEEKELMKNVEGWEVGTWFGEPIYNNYPKDKLLPPCHHEYYAHASPNAFFKWMEFRRYA